MAECSQALEILPGGEELARRIFEAAERGGVRHEAGSHEESQD